MIRNQELLNDILDLRNKNTPISIIAEILNVSKPTVCVYSKILIYQGKIKMYKNRKVNLEELNTIEKLKKENKRNDEIAKILGVSKVTVSNKVRALISMGRLNYISPEEIANRTGRPFFTKEKQEEIKKLREEGLTNRQIAVKLNVCYGTIFKKLGPQPTNILTIKQAKLKELKEQGKTNKEIAIIMGVTMGTINRQGFRLRKRGIIPSLKGIKYRGKIEFKITPFYQEIIDLYHTDYKPKEIAEKLNLPKSSIRKIINKLFYRGYIHKKEHKISLNSKLQLILALTNQGIKPRYIAKELNFPIGFVYHNISKLKKMGYLGKKLK